MSVHITYDEDGNVTSVGLSELEEEPVLIYEIRAKENVDRMELALWLRQTGFDCTYSQTLYIADCLLRGETWRPPVESVTNVGDNPYTTVKVVDAND